MARYLSDRCLIKKEFARRAVNESFLRFPLTMPKVVKVLDVPTDFAAMVTASAARPWAAFSRPAPGTQLPRCTQYPVSATAVNSVPLFRTPQ